MVRTLFSTAGIVCLALAALELTDGKYLPAVLLAVAGAAVFVARTVFPLPGRRDQQ